MGQPTSSQVHYDAILANYSLAYMQNPGSFIATKVFPMLPVEKQSDRYYVIDKNGWFTDEMELRPPGTESAGSGFTLSTQPYYCDLFALHKDVNNQERKNADKVINLERLTTRWLTQKALIKLERQWVSDYFTTGVWGTDKTGGTDFTPWSNKATSDPQADIEAAKLGVLSTTGFEGNTLVLGYQTFQGLKQHPAIKDQIKHTSAQSITAEMLSAVFEIPNVYVAKAVYASNNEGETAAYAMTHGKHAWFGYVDPNPAPETPTAGLTFVWEGIEGNLGENVTIGRFEIPEKKVERFEIEMAWDNKVVAADLGYFFSGAVA